MAKNFRIQQHRKKGDLHISLIGDFDGSSAMELIDVLMKNAKEAEKIFVHTCFVSSMNPFGREVFKKKLCVPEKVSQKFVFTGQYRNCMALEACC